MKKLVFGRYYTTRDIAKRVGKKRSTIEYHVKKGNIPKPKLHLTFVRFLGKNVAKYDIRLWNKRQLNQIEKDMRKVYKGYYPGFVHPVTKKFKQPPSHIRFNKKNKRRHD